MLMDVLGGVGELGQLVALVGEQAELAGLNEGVTDRDVEWERVSGRLGEGREAGYAQGGDQQAEAGDGDGERIDVHTVDRLQGKADPLVAVTAGRVSFPLR